MLFFLFGYFGLSLAKSKSPIVIASIGLQSFSAVYHEFLDDREYDCPIDLVADSKVPKSRTYSLSAPESLAMNQYIKKNLENRFSHPSRTPAGAVLFFVAK